MLTKFRDFFANDKVFLISTIVSVIGIGINGLHIIINSSNYFYAFVSLLEVICIIIMYTSYIHHEKNVMKGIIGTFLGINVVFQSNTVLTAVSNLVTNNVPFSSWNITSIIFLVISILFAINHFLINSDHHSNPTRVFLNQLLIIANAITAIIVYASIISMRIASNTSTLNIIVLIICAIGAAVTFNVIACIETRLDVYRVEREANGWKPEDSK